MKVEKYKKIIPGVPLRDPGFIACGGVLDLNEEQWEWDREHERGRAHSPKLGEAGSDEEQYGVCNLKPRKVR